MFPTYDDEWSNYHFLLQPIFLVVFDSTIQQLYGLCVICAIGRVIAIDNLIVLYNII